MELLVHINGIVHLEEGREGGEGGREEGREGERCMLLFTHRNGCSVFTAKKVRILDSGISGYMYL